jgi:hypothetical protein
MSDESVNKEQMLTDRIMGLKGWPKSEWSELSLDGRLALLNQAHRIHAELFGHSAAGIDISPVKFSAPRLHLVAFWDPRTNYIFFSSDAMEAETSRDVLKGLFHCSYYLYQREVVISPEAHPEVDTKRKSEWREGFENKLSPLPGLPLWGCYEFYDQ